MSHDRFCKYWGWRILLSVKRDYEAYLDDMNSVTILLPKSAFQGEEKTFYLERNHRLETLEIVDAYPIEPFQKYVCKLCHSIEFGKTYYIQDEKGVKTDLQIGAVIRSKEFDDQFYYDRDDLGVSFNENSIVCKIWAPIATAVKIRLTNPSNFEVKEYPLTRENKGVWTINLEGRFENFYYTYLVCVNLIWRELVDPYAKAVSVNGEFGVIIDLTKTKVEKIKVPPLTQATDAIIYELHIRDFTIHPNSGIKRKGKYLGLAENDTKTKNGYTTGLTYLRELGVTHVELLPINDFAGVDEEQPNHSYNWGYNPLHYNAPEGSYALNPYDPYSRIIELKQMIQAFHRHGLKVIMDVVYNHVFIRESSHFEKLVPGYFFRHDQYGIPSNGSGVGNDIASERKMVRKFIVDSIRFWLEEYDVDGFRFDLMGLLDIETMNEVRKVTSSRKKDAIILGEGWDMSTPLPYDRKAIIANSVKMMDIAFFNDHFRDTVKGSTFDLVEKGFSLGNVHKKSQMVESITGSISFNSQHRGLFQHPVQSINYVESHDNHTFWDKMTFCLDEEDEDTKRKRQRLATSIVLLSQGIPFLHSGQEFFRTKKGEGNSYNLPDCINQIDWSSREQFDEEIDYVKKLIQLRKLHGAFRFAKAELVKKHCTFLETNEGIMAYQLHNVLQFGPWSHLIIVHCNQKRSKRLSLTRNGDWQLICTPKVCSPEKPLHIIQEKLEVQDIGTYVLYQT